MKASSSAFVDYLTEHEEDLEDVCEGLIKVLVADHKNDRIVVPLFKTVMSCPLRKHQYFST